MPEGFFAGSILAQSKPPPSLVAKCGACGLYKTCKSPKMPPTGKGKRKILVVAEAPGKDEDEQGIQLIGKSGQLFRRILREHGVDLDRDCLKTNTLICRPPDNATPTAKQISYCRPNLIKTLQEFKPTTIILLGGPAVEAVIGWAWKENVGPIGRWVGWNIPHQRLNAWICPVYHPAYLLREQNQALDLLFGKHIENAISNEGVPWPNGTPDYRGEVECITSPTKAAKAIRDMTKRGLPSAFDYETNRLKPERDDSQIVCCSISNGKWTIAYPWHGEAIDATREFVRSPVPKIASNMKFEERWTRRILRTRVKNWRWCTMTGAHVLDHRQGITSVKFQSLVRLGYDSYDDHIGEFLHGKGGQGLNRILSEIDLSDLLTYCGIDSLVELLVAELQTKQIGFRLRQ